jgi:hypothetical protein
MGMKKKKKKIEREMSSQGKERKEWNLKTDGR